MNKDVNVIGMLLNHKENKILPFAEMQMDLKICLVNLSCRERQILYDITICDIQKVTQMNAYAKQKQTHRNKKTNL